MGSLLPFSKLYPWFWDNISLQVAHLKCCSGIPCEWLKGICVSGLLASCHASNFKDPEVKPPVVHYINRYT